MTAAPCLSCGSPVTGAYCGNCGERRLAGDELTLRAQAGQLLGGLFSIDGRLWRSLAALVARPGFLAVEYCRGARTRWMRPVQIFLVANLVYFFVQPWTGFNALRATLDLQISRQRYSGHTAGVVERYLAHSGQPPDEYTARFDMAAGDLARLLVIFLVPVAALVMHSLAPRGRRTFIEHLVLATHYTAFQLIVVYTSVLGAVRLLRQVVEFRFDEDLGALVAIILYASWMVPAWRRFHGTSLRRALLAGVIVSLSAFPTVIAYRYLLFWVCHWSAT